MPAVLEIGDLSTHIQLTKSVVQAVGNVGASFLEAGPHDARPHRRHHLVRRRCARRRCEELGEDRRVGRDEVRRRRSGGAPSWKISRSSPT